MATRSTIIVEMAAARDLGDKAWSVIDVHRLGEPEERASLLLDYYADSEKVRGLIALGDLSLIDREITCPPSHSFETPVDGHSIAYGRDRGEDDEDVAPRFFPTLAAALRAATEEFAYVYQGGVWWWAFTDGLSAGVDDLRRLTPHSRRNDGLAT